MKLKWEIYRLIFVPIFFLTICDVCWPFKSFILVSKPVILNHLQMFESDLILFSMKSMTIEFIDHTWRAKTCQTYVWTERKNRIFVAKWITLFNLSNKSMNFGSFVCSNETNVAKNNTINSIQLNCRSGKWRQLTSGPIHTKHNADQSKCS